MQQDTAVVTVKTLLLTDLVDSTKLVEKLGDRKADRIFRRHERIARDLLDKHNGIEIDKSDGFLFVFDRPLDAVSYALNYHRSLSDLSEEMDQEIRARSGIHLGELVLRENDPADVARGAKPREVEGLAKPTAARLMSLSLPGQLLLSRGAFDLARRASVGEDPGLGKLEWLDHGPYEFKGIEDPVQVFEVGIEGLSPLEPPLDSAKARRVHYEFTTDVALTKAGRYEIKRKLAEGGQGSTYEAFDPVIKRKVLIKQIRYGPELSSTAQQEFRERFIREAEAAGRLSHSNIASVFDVGEEKGKPFLAMEFVEGRTLQKMIELEGPLSEERALHYFEQLCRGLEHAHKNGIIHRDIKPSNLIITANDRLKIVDFGVAKTERSELTKTGTLIGTLYYMSPEQIKGAVVDHRADQFAAAVVLYQALTGEYPFSGSHPTTIIYKIVNDPPKPIHDFSTVHPPELDQIITKALAKDPSDRYESCKEFANKLRDFITSRSAGESETVVPPEPVEKTEKIEDPVPPEIPAEIEPTGLPEEIHPPEPAEEEPERAERKEGVSALEGAEQTVAETGPTESVEAGQNEIAVEDESTAEHELDQSTEGQESDRSKGPVDWLRENKLIGGIAAGVVFVILLTIVLWPGGPSESQLADETSSESSLDTPDQMMAGDAVTDSPDVTEETEAEVPEVDQELLDAQNARNRGLELYQQGNYSAAIREFNLATERLTDDAEIFYSRGRSYLETKRANPAVRDLRRAVSLASSNPEYRLYLASALESAGSWQEAATHYRRAGSLGGFRDLNPADLEAKAEQMELIQQIEDLTPISSEAEHDHFIGGCKGTLEMTSETLAYRTSENPDHAFEIPILDLVSVEVRVKELRLVLPEDKPFNFKLEDPESFSQVYRLKLKLEGRPSLSEEE